MKNLLVISIRASRAFLFFPTRTKSSANRRAEMLVSWRSIPRPDELSSAPRSLMNKENKSGLKLQTGMRNSYSSFQGDFLTLLDTLREEEFISVLIIDVKTNGIIVIHTLYN